MVSGQQQPFSQRFEGPLEAYQAGPDEPVLWAIHEADRPGPEGVHALLNGDFLTVYGETDEILWAGLVDLDFEAHLAPDPLEPGSLRQHAHGRWVHGLQRGEDAEAWAQLFFEGRRALVKR